MGEAVKGYLTKFMRKWKKNDSFELPELTRTIVTGWLKNPFTLGSYSYRVVDSDPLKLKPSDLAKSLKVNGVPRVLFAGEATSDEHYTAVHGAMESGEEAARKIVNFK